MMTLRMLSAKPSSLPTLAGFYLADLGEAKGKQEIYTRQSPQRLKVLREHALIESAVSSNRIEGVTVDQDRVRTLVFGKPYLQDRNEEEVRGYREALRLIHEKRQELPVTEDSILHLHRLIRGEIADAGQYKEKDSDIIETCPDGRSRIRFRTVPAKATPAAVVELITLWHDCLTDRSLPPLIALAAFNLDFLSIHPFRDGNGRVSRLLLLLQSYHLGFEVGRYVSLERIIEQNKERYYETLEHSSQGWHEGKHDPWPYMNYVLYIFKTAYREFEERLGQIKSPRGEKSDSILTAIQNSTRPFTVRDLQDKCPGVGVDLIRKILKKEKQGGRVECLGRGRDAKWKKIGNR